MSEQERARALLLGLALGDALGCLYQGDPDRLREVAHATGIATHGHPEYHDREVFFLVFMRECNEKQDL